MRSRSHSVGARAFRVVGFAWLLIGPLGLMCMAVAVVGAVALGVPRELSPLPDQPGLLQAQLLETLARPTSISTYGGWSAWSRYDSAHRAYQLMAQNTNGVVMAMGV